MKQFFLALTLSFVTVLSVAARPVSEDPAVEKTFRQLFTGASNVTWSKESRDLVKASFLWGQHHTVAYFDKKGNLLGSIRGLFFTQLPLSVIRSVNTQYADHMILEVREISNEEGVSYSLISEHKGKRYKLRYDSLGGLIDKARVRK